jgi:molecular chaperone GrpE
LKPPEKKNSPGDGQNAGNGNSPEVTVNTEEKALLAGLEEKLKEKEDKYLRLAAEFDNYRKRTLREKADLTKFVGGDIISGLLPVIDDIDRAIESMNEAKDMDAMQKGIKLIRDKFKEFLKQKGVTEIQALGQEFDTDLHEAITKIPAPDKKDKGKIIDVIVKGYILHDKVIRYSKVVVGE